MKLLIAPNKLLSSKITELVKEGEVIDFQSMFKLMFEHRGCGLAAPQVGINKRFFILKDEVVVNPEIKWMSPETQVAMEGCLSLPGIQLPVRRSKEIIVRYDNGEEKFLRGMDARVFQHEFDHLEGVLITDRFAELYRC